MVTAREMETNRATSGIHTTDAQECAMDAVRLTQFLPSELVMILPPFPDSATATNTPRLDDQHTEDQSSSADEETFCQETPSLLIMILSPKPLFPTANKILSSGDHVRDVHELRAFDVLRLTQTMPSALVIASSEFPALATATNRPNSLAQTTEDQQLSAGVARDVHVHPSRLVITR
jgi:hypothetical protein